VRRGFHNTTSRIVHVLPSSCAHLTGDQASVVLLLFIGSNVSGHVWRSNASQAVRLILNFHIRPILIALDSKPN